MADIYIYDVIGAGMFEDGVTAISIRDQLKEHEGSPVNVHINSPGGDVFEGIAIKSQLERHSGEVSVFIDGLAASAASVIALAGKTIKMAQGAMIMIHEAWAVTIGDEEEHKRSSETLGKVSGNLAEMYSKRTGDTPESMRELMRAETWLTADEAVEANLADDVVDATAQACVVPPEFGYRNCPQTSSPATHSTQIAAMRRRVSLLRVRKQLT